jgi:ketosteroid isomerase-like protein
MKTIYATLLILLLCLWGCEVKTTTTVTTESSEEKTKEVLDHHWQTFQSNDLDGVMADYTDESVLIIPDTTLVGLTALRQHFARVFTVFPKDSTTLQLDKSVIHQDVGYIIWQATAPKIKVTYGTDTFIIQNGKIVRQTFAGVISPI